MTRKPCSQCGRFGGQHIVTCPWDPENMDDTKEEEEFLDRDFCYDDGYEYDMHTMQLKHLEGGRR